LIIRRLHIVAAFLFFSGKHPSNIQRNRRGSMTRLALSFTINVMACGMAFQNDHRKMKAKSAFFKDPISGEERTSRDKKPIVPLISTDRSSGDLILFAPHFISRGMES
jgi:hypothetical protein